MIAKLLRRLAGRCTHVWTGIAGRATSAQPAAGLPRKAVRPVPRIDFVRLTEVPPEAIIAHMSDPRVIEHMPLANFEWTAESCADFVAGKEASWARDGLGHWAIFSDGAYVGWGGFEKEEGEEWDFGLVLRPDCFGLGIPIARKALRFAREDPRIPFVTFLLPPSRPHLGGLARLGARYLGKVDYDGTHFLKFRLDTE